MALLYVQTDLLSWAHATDQGVVINALVAIIPLTYSRFGLSGPQFMIKVTRQVLFPLEAC